jgi:hypothetical protein
MTEVQSSAIRRPNISLCLLLSGFLTAFPSFHFLFQFDFFTTVCVQIFSLISARDSIIERTRLPEDRSLLG